MSLNVTVQTVVQFADSRTDLADTITGSTAFQPTNAEGIFDMTIPTTSIPIFIPFPPTVTTASVVCVKACDHAVSIYTEVDQYNMPVGSALTVPAGQAQVLYGITALVVEASADNTLVQYFICG